MLKLERYVGSTVDIIYMDRLERITQRRVVVLRLQEGVVEALCLQRQQHRRFRVDRILSVRRVGGSQIG